MITSGISGPFGPLFRTSRQVTNVLLTRLPLVLKNIAIFLDPFDLHALDTPPAFILSQDQTLNYSTAWDLRPLRGLCHWN